MVEEPQRAAERAGRSVRCRAAVLIVRSGRLGGGGTARLVGRPTPVQQPETTPGKPRPHHTVPPRGRLLPFSFSVLDPTPESANTNDPTTPANGSRPG